MLFLEEKRYSYVGRFEYLYNRNNFEPPPVRIKFPDFVAEDNRRRRVIAESKGGFCQPGKKLHIKGRLKEGLDQVNFWEGRIDYQKSFVIGTFLREKNDPVKEPSLIAFVDPDPGVPESPVEFPPVAIRRANYAACLSLMGLQEAARRLWEGGGEPETYELLPLILGDRRYWVNVLGLFWDRPGVFPLLPPPAADDVYVELAGFDMEVLDALSDATQRNDSKRLTALSPLERRDISGESGMETEYGRFFGSIFSDGSLWGILRLWDRRDRRYWPFWSFWEAVLPVKL